MQWSESHEEGIQILKLSGEVDLMHSSTLRKLLRERIETQCRALVLDFSGVEYLDSSGLAALIECSRDARSYGGAFAISGLTRTVQTIFDLIRAGELLAIFPRLEDAKASPLFRNAPADWR